MNKEKAGFNPAFFYIVPKSRVDRFCFTHSAVIISLPMLLLEGVGACVVTFPVLSTEIDIP